MILAPGDIVADKYCIERLIGEGGMGTVYAATNQMTGRTVALKWLRGNLASDEVFTQRFMREARVGGRLDHPNIVNVFDVGRHGDSVFLVMELLRGEPFDVWLRSEPRSPAECIGHLMPALRAVAAAHEVGVVHRDLKPENIFICMDSSRKVRQTKVLDFGIAKELGTADPAGSLTSPGSLVGTIHYMAPEQVRNSRFADVRSDVYSLGVILYHSLSGGELPFEAESLGQLILEIADGSPKPLGERNPNLPRGLADIVMRAMSRDAKDRPQTVAALASALEPYSGGARFDSLRPSHSLSTSAPISRDFPSVKQTSTLASAASGVDPAPRRVSKVLIIVPTLVGLAIAAYLSAKGGSWLFSGGAPEKPAGAAAPPTGPAGTLSEGRFGAEPVVQAVSTGEASAEVAREVPSAPASAGEAPAATMIPAPLQPPRVVKEPRPKEARSAAAPASASAAPASPPKPAQGFTYEQNPYLRR